MQNRVKAPSGLRTGSGPRYVSSGAKVTCSDSLCDNEPTHVLVHTTFEGKTVRMGAHCAPCLDGRIKPEAEVDAANERDILHGGTGGLNGLPDTRWSTREFTPEESADIELIKAGELVETYLAPGEFEWRPPVAPDTKEK